MTDKTLQERLREHRVILKSGDYDGAQLMAAWCDMVNAADALDAQAERIKALEGALRTLVISAQSLDNAFKLGCRFRDNERHPEIACGLVNLRTFVDRARALLGEK